MKNVCLFPMRPIKAEFVFTEHEDKPILFFRLQVEEVVLDPDFEFGDVNGVIMLPFHALKFLQDIRKLLQGDNIAEGLEPTPTVEKMDDGYFIDYLGIDEVDKDVFFYYMQSEHLRAPVGEHYLAGVIIGLGNGRRRSETAKDTKDDEDDDITIEENSVLECYFTPAHWQELKSMVEAAFLGLPEDVKDSFWDALEEHKVPGRDKLRDVFFPPWLVLKK